MTAMQKYDIEKFVMESNEIENIHGIPTKKVIEATYNLIYKPTDLVIWDLELFQAAICERKQPHLLRESEGMDVRVGGHRPPPGGHHIRVKLEKILTKATISLDPWQTHCEFETLHPFTDGNGRTGRALWAWQMQKLGRDPFALPFLHRFYYQTLEHSR